MNATNRRPASLVSREAVERLAAEAGVSVLAMLTNLAMNPLPTNILVDLAARGGK